MFWSKGVCKINYLRNPNAAITRRAPSSISKQTNRRTGKASGRTLVTPSLFVSFPNRQPTTTTNCNSFAVKRERGAKIYCCFVTSTAPFMRGLTTVGFGNLHKNGVPFFMLRVILFCNNTKPPSHYSTIFISPLFRFNWSIAQMAPLSQSVVQTMSPLNPNDLRPVRHQRQKVSLHFLLNLEKSIGRWCPEFCINLRKLLSAPSCNRFYHSVPVEQCTPKIFVLLALIHLHSYFQSFPLLTRFRITVPVTKSIDAMQAAGRKSPSWPASTFGIASVVYPRHLQIPEFMMQRHWDSCASLFYCQNNISGLHNFIQKNYTTLFEWSF